MKTLKKCIIESLLDDEDEVFNGAKEGIIKEFLKTNYKINGSYTIKEKGNEFIVDVHKDISVINDKIVSLTGGLFKFGEVGGAFNCSYCKDLKSLEGAPQKCLRFFIQDCESLTTLEGAPKEVERCFDCSGTNISSLKGAPKKCDHFNCCYCNKLISLEGAPNECGDFYCCYCNSLISLEGGPKKITGDYECYYCDSLKTLKGAPKEVERFDCSNCKSLKSLEGAPKCTVIAAYNCGKSYGKDDIIKYTGATYKMTRSGSRVKLN